MALDTEDFSYAGEEWQARDYIADYGPGGGTLVISIEGDADAVPEDLVDVAKEMQHDISAVWDEAIEYLGDDTWDYYCEELGGGVPHIHSIHIRGEGDFDFVFGFPGIDHVVIVEYAGGEPSNVETVG